MDSNKVTQELVDRNIFHISDREQRCLQQTKRLIKKKENFEDFNDFFDDEFLLYFVRGKKCDTGKVCKYLENYLYIRTIKYADFFCALDPFAPNLLDKGMTHILRSPDKDGRVVIVDRIDVWDVNEFSIENALQALVLFIDAILRNSTNAVENGVIVIFDLANYNFQHCRALTFPAVMKGMNLMMDSMPLSYKGAHLVNEGRILGLFARSIKPFLKQKLRDRLHFHSTNMSTLHEHISAKILPKSLGGLLTDEEAFDLEFNRRIRGSANASNYKRFKDLVNKNVEVNKY